MSTIELTVNEASGHAGRWVTDREFSRLTGISRQVLANWRSDDRRRGGIQPGRPIWRNFGGCVRYWVGPEFFAHTIGPELLGEYRPRRGQEAGGADRG